MDAVAAEALGLWGLADASCELAGARENSVYRVAGSRGVCALRVHRLGMRTDAEIESELQLLVELARQGLAVPEPVVSAAGKLLHHAGGRQVNILTWLSGSYMESEAGTQPASARAYQFESIGRAAASMHAACDSWNPPAGFRRWSWSASGMLGDDALWGPFWKHPDLDSQQQELFASLRSRAQADLDSRAAGLDWGLIHADLVRENILIEGAEVRFIDFDDCGFGFRLFDLATVLVKQHGQPDYDAVKSALLQGYRSVRAIDDSCLDLLMVVRAATYVAWIATRMREEHASERSERFMRTAQELARVYLRS